MCCVPHGLEQSPEWGGEWQMEKEEREKDLTAGQCMWRRAGGHKLHIVPWNHIFVYSNIYMLSKLENNFRILSKSDYKWDRTCVSLLNPFHDSAKHAYDDIISNCLNAKVSIFSNLLCGVIPHFSPWHYVNTKPLQVSKTRYKARFRYVHLPDSVIESLLSWRLSKGRQQDRFRCLGMKRHHFFFSPVLSIIESYHRKFHVMAWMELFASGERNMVTCNPPIDWTVTVNCTRVQLCTP